MSAASLAETYEEARVAGESEARQAERDRARAIMTSPHAELRDRLARHLALHTDTPADEAVAILAAAPADPIVTERMQ